MEDDLNYFLKKEDDLNFLKMDDDLKKIMQPKTIKSKNNDCGPAPGNLVYTNMTHLFKFGSLLEITFIITIFVNFRRCVHTDSSSIPKFSRYSYNMNQGG